MSSSLESIPVKIEAKAGQAMHWQRRGIQAAFILVLVLIPVTGLMRIDPIAGAFVILDRQVWWSDFFLVFGLWLTLAAGLVLMYSAVGTAFCGWACPQNSLSEWANHMTRKLLGKRAQLELDGKRMQVGSGKNRWLNWLILGVSMLAVSMFFALIPLLYFYPPEVIWSFITFAQDERLAESLHFIYSVFVVVLFLNIAFIRHFWCRFMCVYKVWQHGFKTKQTLHIAYDQSRAELCEKCNYCNTACFIDLDPRKTDIFDSCINCGECITACNKLQAKKGEPGLLSFRLGDHQATKAAFFNLSTRLGSLSTRVRWTIPFALLGLLMFSWGVISYESYHLTVYRADISHGSQILDYRVAVSNKLYKQAKVQITVEGLTPEQFQLSRSEARLETAGRADLELKISDKLKPGLHSILVHAKTADGWHESYRLQHFVAKSS